MPILCVEAHNLMLISMNTKRCWLKMKKFPKKWTVTTLLQTVTALP